MSVDKVASFLILLNACWVLGEATEVTTQGRMYTNVGVPGHVFADSLIFALPTGDLRRCAFHCKRWESCATFTYHNNICRGHLHRMTSYSVSTPAPGARSYSRKVDVNAIGCKETGVKRMTESSLGLNRDVYCEENWLVFQKRQDGSVDFIRNWQNYTTGFGDVLGEHWLGLEPLHRITTSGGNYELRVNVTAWNGTTASAFYSNFYVGPAASNYTLHFDQFRSGAAGNSLLINWNKQFSTWDADHDTHDMKNCAANRRGGWWYSACGKSNLNGQYYTEEKKHKRGIKWHTFTDDSLKSDQMMIKPGN